MSAVSNPTYHSNNMLAFKASRDGSSSLDCQAPVPVPGPEEALVRVLRAGICNTDLEILKGYMGFQGVLGHEFVGQVRLNDARREKTGLKVFVVVIPKEGCARMGAPIFLLV